MTARSERGQIRERQDDGERARRVTRKKRYQRSDKRTPRPLRLVADGQQRTKRRSERRGWTREAGAQGHGDKAVGELWR